MPSLDIAEIVHHDGLESYQRELARILESKLRLLGVPDADISLVLSEFDKEWDRNLSDHDVQIIRTYRDSVSQVI